MSIDLQSFSRFSQIRPRTYINSSNADALVLQSQQNETRVTFLNNTTRFVLATSNNDFIVSNRDVPIARANITDNTPHFTINGVTSTCNLLFQGTGTRQVVLSEYSPSQFAGFGYTGDALHYSTPSVLGRHIFNANIAGFNKELVRIQNTAEGTQMGVGLTGPLRTIEAGTALKVGGTTHIEGDLVLNGNIVGNSSYLTANQPVPRYLLPQNLVYTEPNNKISDSLLNESTTNFLQLKSQRSIGIGTRTPVQRLHVQGSTVISERLGVGTFTPSSRLHIIENGASIPTVVLQNTHGGSIIEAYGETSNIPAFIVYADPPRIGIGTSDLSLDKVLTANGDVLFQSNVTVDGILMVQKLQAHDFAVVNEQNANSPVIDVEFLTDSNNSIVPTINVHYPFISRSSFFTDSISPYSNSNISIQGQLTLSSQPAVTPVNGNRTIINNALMKVKLLSGYLSQSESGETSTVSAQEVFNVFPQATRTMSDGTKVIVYDAFIPLLIQAIKELSAP